MNSIKCVGICGYAGAGKDTVANILEWTIYDSVIAHLSDPLKNICAELYALPKKYFTSRELKEKVIPELNRSPREILQFVGTNLIRRHLDKDIWIKNLERRYKNFTGTLIIPDVRFENELDWILSKNGIILHVIRPGYKGNVGIPNHPSEFSLSFDTAKAKGAYYEINNDGDIDDLTRKIHKLLDTLIYLE